MKNASAMMLLCAQILLAGCQSNGGREEPDGGAPEDPGYAGSLSVVGLEAKVVKFGVLKGAPQYERGALQVLFTLQDDTGAYVTDSSKVAAIRVEKPDGSSVEVPVNSSFSFIFPEMTLMEGFVDVGKGANLIRYWSRVDFNDVTPLAGEYRVVVKNKAGQEFTGRATFQPSGEDPISGFPEQVQYEASTRTVTWLPPGGASEYRISLYADVSPDGTLDFSGLIHTAPGEPPITEPKYVLPASVSLEKGRNYFVRVDAMDGTPSQAGSYLHRAVSAPVMVTDLVQVAQFGDNPGNLDMFVYVPAHLPPKAPLVVALHGNGTSAANLTNAGWNQLADEFGFAVLYPQQKSVNSAGEAAGLGFGYWKPGTGQHREDPEPRSIIQMINYMIENHDLDSGRVFATGLSGGGAMTLVLLAGYPEVFNAGATIAGMPYKCATNEAELLDPETGCATLTLPFKPPTKNRTAEAWGDLVRSARPGYLGPYPRLSIWHGEFDNIIHADMLTQTMKQWTNVHGISETAAETTKPIPALSRALYKNAEGRSVVETNLLASLGHAFPVDPESSAVSGGCGAATQFYEPAGICAGLEIARFWGIAP